MSSIPAVSSPAPAPVPVTAPTTAAAAFEPAEWQVRMELAAAYQLLAREGLDDGIWNHLSCAVPGHDDLFLLKPHGLLFSQVTASSLIVVAQDGTLVRGEGRWEPTAFYIHSRVHAAFADMPCVMHLHPPFATALCCAEQNRLLPLTQDCLRFHERLGYLERYDGLALSDVEGDIMVEAMRGNTALMMASHGVLVGGRTVAEALYDMHYLELACKSQAMAVQAAAGNGLRLVEPEVASLAYRQLNRNRLTDAAMHLEAHMRLLDETGSNFRD